MLLVAAVCPTSPEPNLYEQDVLEGSGDLDLSTPLMEMGCSETVRSGRVWDPLNLEV